VRVLGVGPLSVADVTNRDRLCDGEAWFVAAPLPVVGGDGGPCRAFAVVAGREGEA
jgi:kynurenine formamidase